MEKKEGERGGEGEEGEMQNRIFLFFGHRPKGNGHLVSLVHTHTLSKTHTHTHTHTHMCADTVFFRHTVSLFFCGLPLSSCPGDIIIINISIKASLSLSSIQLNGYSKSNH